MSFEKTSGSNQPTAPGLDRTNGPAGGVGLIPTETGEKWGRDAKISPGRIDALFSSESDGACCVKEGLARC